MSRQSMLLYEERFLKSLQRLLDERNKDDITIVDTEWSLTPTEYIDEVCEHLSRKRNDDPYDKIYKINEWKICDELGIIKMISDGIVYDITYYDRPMWSDWWVMEEPEDKRFMLTISLHQSDYFFKNN